MLYFSLLLMKYSSWSIRSSPVTNFYLTFWFQCKNSLEKWTFSCIYRRIDILHMLICTQRTAECFIKQLAFYAQTQASRCSDSRKEKSSLISNLSNEKAEKLMKKRRWEWICEGQNRPGATWPTRPRATNLVIISMLVCCFSPTFLPAVFFIVELLLEIHSQNDPLPNFLL